MSLPPDPHDDDLAQSAEEAAGDAPAAPAAPSPAAIDGPVPPPPPAADAPDATTTAAPPPAADGRDAATTTAQPPVATAPAPGATARDAAGAAPARGRRRLALAGAAVVVAALGLAGGLALAGGDGGDGDTAAATEDEAPAAEADPTEPPDVDEESGDVPGPADEAAAGDARDDDPVAAAEGFLAAVEARDCAAMVDLLTPESYAGRSADEAVAACEDDAATVAVLANARWGDVELVDRRGDEAVVQVAVALGADESVERLVLRRTDGGWRVHLDDGLDALAD
ncbi:MAG TPA: hypothetical protein VKZ72_00635 [Acidimicrobiales bacterium]|nr:hypothetical protein [Acidimicrobiales bacterium]